MIDANLIIADNIRREMNKQTKSCYDLSVVTGLSLKELRARMDGAKAFNTRELREIAEFLRTTTQELTRFPENYEELDSVRQLHKKCTSENQYKTVDIADKLSDMILFHKKTRENGIRMMREVSSL